MLEEVISKKYNLLKPFLDEQSKRLFAAAEAISLGDRWNQHSFSCNWYFSMKPFQKVVMTKTGTVEELSHLSLMVKFELLGGGRKKSVDKDPTLVSDLETLIEPTSRGDPESPLRWTSKSTRKLAEELKKIGHKVSHSRVADMLHMLGYSLQANRKTIEGTSHPDRDQQFNHINEKCKEFQEENQPVISVDTKKKELVGNFKNEGKELRPKNDPINCQCI